MKKLIIAVNHSYPDSVGGCEKVVSQVANGLSDKYDYECMIMSNSAKARKVVDGIQVHPCRMVSSEFVNQINSYNPDHLFVYSDSFYQWPFVVQSAKKIHCSKSIALVGMNAMMSNNMLFHQFKKIHEDFSVVTHSNNYQDFIKCEENSIPVNVIPNSVDLDEFKIEQNDFREKYDVSEKKIILCVSNFFPGKGQEFLIPIFEKLYEIRKDFILVLVSATSVWSLIESRGLSIEVKMGKASFKSLFLRDIPREDVVSAFLSSDVFVFPSQK